MVGMLLIGILFVLLIVNLKTNNEYIATACIWTMTGLLTGAIGSEFGWW